MRSPDVKPGRCSFRGAVVFLLAFLIAASVSGAAQQVRQGGSGTNLSSVIQRLGNETGRPANPRIIRGRQEPVAPPETNLSLTIRCTNTTLLVGDEISIEFCVSNRSKFTFPYKTPITDRNGGGSGEFWLTAIDERGNKIVEPRKYRQSGLYIGDAETTIALASGDTTKEVVALNMCALINAPGRYEVTGRHPIAGSSPPITIVVKPRTDAEMQDYIEDLAEQIRLNGTGNSSIQTIWFRAEMIQKLMFTCHPGAIPILIDYWYAPEATGWETDAFLWYLPRNEATRQLIVDMGEKRGYPDGMKNVLSQYYRHMRGRTAEEMYPLIKRFLAPENPSSWLDGVYAAQVYANDDFTPRLIEIAKGPAFNLREEAIYALALNRNDESVKALRSFLFDPDTATQDAARRAIRNGLKSDRGDAQGRPLRAEDFDELF